MTAPAKAMRDGSAAPAARKRGQWKELPSAADLRDQKAKALFRQAALAFHQKGYAATSIADIAERLGVSKAALYHYIGNKQELLFQCHLVASDAADEALAYVPEEGMTGLEKLRTGLRCYLQAVLSDDSASVVALEESALEPENLKTVLRRRDRFQGQLKAFILEGVEDGSIIRCDPKLATFGVLGGVNWADKWYRAGGVWKANQIAAAIADLMVRSLAVRPEPTMLSVNEYPNISAQEELGLHLPEAAEAGVLGNKRYRAKHAESGR